MAPRGVPRARLCNAGHQHHRRSQPHVHLSRRVAAIEPLTRAEHVLSNAHRRSVLSHVVIGAILLGSAFSIFNQHDYWPFSHYPMFAELQSADLSMFEVVGIVAG